MAASDPYPYDDTAGDKLQRTRIWKWAGSGAVLWGIGSALMLRGSCCSAETVAENVTFVAVNAFVGAVLGLLAGWFAVPKQRDPRRPRWLW